MEKLKINFVNYEKEERLRIKKDGVSSMLIMYSFNFSRNVKSSVANREILKIIRQYVQNDAKTVQIITHYPRLGDEDDEGGYRSSNVFKLPQDIDNIEIFQAINDSDGFDEEYYDLIDRFEIEITK